MKLPLCSVKSSAPAFLLSRYFEGIDGVTAVVVHGRGEDWVMDVTYLGATYELDKQFGEVQAFAPTGEVSEQHRASFIDKFKTIPRGLGGAVFAALTGRAVHR